MPDLFHSTPAQRRALVARALEGRGSFDVLYTEPLTSGLSLSAIVFDYAARERRRVVVADGGLLISSSRIER
jgi:hypothetical protein